MPDIRKKVISLADPHLKMAEDIMEWESLTSVSEALRRAIYTYHMNNKPPEEPAYLKMFRLRTEMKKRIPLETAPPAPPAPPADTPETKAAAEKLIVDANLDKKYTRILNKLYRPQILIEPNGEKSCIIPLFTMTVPGHVERGEIKLPLSDVNDEIISQQFDGPRKEIISIIERQ